MAKVRGPAIHDTENIQQGRCSANTAAVQTHVTADLGQKGQDGNILAVGGDTNVSDLPRQDLGHPFYGGLRLRGIQPSSIGYIQVKVLWSIILVIILVATFLTSQGRICNRMVR